MTSPGGGFFSSPDADSDGEEGAFYVWQRDEIGEAPDDAEFSIVERRFGLDRAPNFEGHAWYLRAVASFDEVAAALLGLTREAVDSHWQTARRKPLRLRGARTRPGPTTRSLTAWNAPGGRRHRAREAARATISVRSSPKPSVRSIFCMPTRGAMDDCTLRIRAALKLAAYLDDYAFLLDALLALLRVRWNARDLARAIALADALLARFEDPDAGGLLLHRARCRKSCRSDRRRSSTNRFRPAMARRRARAADVGHLVGEPRYLDAAERVLCAGWDMPLEYPHACCEMLLAGEFLDPPAHRRRALPRRECRFDVARRARRERTTGRCVFHARGCRSPARRARASADGIRGRRVPLQGHRL